MKLFAVIFMVLGCSFSAQASGDCDNADTLFSGGQAYKCQLASGTPICLKMGYHNVMKTDGFRLFEIDDTKADSVQQMFFDDKVFLKCKIAFLKACTHEEISITDSIISGYSYKAPDMWDGRSIKKSFEYDFDKASGELVVKSYGVDGKLSATQTTVIGNCK